MRPISEATQAILKSQKLTGQNEFSHEIKLEGYDAGYGDIEETLQQTIHSSAIWADYCIRSDGKVLFAYSSGSNVYLKVIESEEFMLTNANSGTGGELFYTMGEISSPECFSLLKLKSGRILLFINDAGKLNGQPYAFKVFESASGLGNDFSLISTISTSARVESTVGIYLKNFVSKGAQANNGDVWIFGGVRFTYSGYDMVYHDVYKSADGGNTWIRKNRLQTSPTWGGRYSNPRNIVIIGNTIFMTYLYSYADFETHLLISSDFGETWSRDSRNFPNFPTSAADPLWRELIDFHCDGYKLFMIIGTPSNKASLFSAEIPSLINYDFLNNMSNWSLIQLNIDRYTGMPGYLTVSPRGIIHFLNKIIGAMNDTGMTRELYSAEFPTNSISISKGNSGSNDATIQADNQNGILNPKNPDSPLFGILGTNKRVTIKQGYSDDLIEVFTGMIDGFDMSTWPQITTISLRDNLKKALDQTITYNNGHTAYFGLQPIENIVQFLCYLAGMEVGEVEATGIRVEKTFSWESYADAFQFLGDLASFEWGCDEYGKFYFRRDYQPANMFVAYTFEEGVDIASLSYSIKDDDLYYKVIVFGEDSNKNVISYEAPFLDAATYNILPQKILKIDATEAQTIAELRKIAERAIALIQSRTAVVSFSSIGVPWLQVGDFIGVYERSTGASSVYRISNLNLQMGTDSFTMDIEASYYGDSIVPGELPTDTATQTVAPAVNLIPEMTSNNAPSGAAKASSVYSSSFEPWQAFNESEEDLYWNSITNTGWIEYQFAQKMIIDKYIIKARQLTSYNDAMPKNWTFEGFDGSKWVVLDTRINQTAWGAYETRTYLFTNTTAYSKYRLNVSRNNGYNRLQVERLAMFYGGGA